MSINIILAFHELRLPMEDGGKGEWCTYDKDDIGMFYLLNKNRYNLCDVGSMEDSEIDANLYFDTEADCHKAAAEYYDSYGKVYPYTAEWLAARKIQPAIKKSSTNEVHSQIMVFE